MTFYQWIFCCDVNVCKWIRTFFILCKQMFISWKLAELMKSGRSIVQRSPFISWKARGCSWAPEEHQLQKAAEACFWIYDTMSESQLE